MNGTVVTQFLIDITRGHLHNVYQENPSQVIEASALSKEMRAAVQEQDIFALWLAGVSPMALLYFARMSGWAMDRYYDTVARAELTKADQARLDQPDAHEPPRTRQ